VNKVTFAVRIYSTQKYNEHCKDSVKQKQCEHLDSNRMANSIPLDALQKKVHDSKQLRLTKGYEDDKQGCGTYLELQRLVLRAMC
jgi:hypothetical protein